MDERPSVFVGGYKHRMDIACPNCDGTGDLSGQTCMACYGKRTIMLGCGGAAEVDNYSTAYCTRCKRIVPSDELSG